MAEKIPPGIYRVSWRNKKERGTQERYRVKVKRKEYQADKLFDTLAEAKSFLDDLKSPAGRIVLSEREMAREKLKNAMADFFKNPKVSWYLNKYFASYVRPKYEGDNTLVRQRSLRTLEHIQASIERVEIDFIPREITDSIQTPRFGNLIRDRHAQRKKFGDLRLMDINDEVASSYIRERSKKVAPSTVNRELSMIGSMYSKLKFIDKKAWEAIGKRNPFLDADRTPLEKPREGRDEEAGRLTKEGEDNLYAVLANTKKRGFKEPSLMLQIVSLALITGMRRGEVLELQWSRIREDRIVLRSIDTKTGKPRWIPLSDEARAILDTVPKSGEKLFSYSPDGFATNWRRIRKKAGIPDFRFHDTRREFISRCLDLLTNIAPVVLARQTGMASVAHLEKAYIEPHAAEKMIKEGIQSERDVMRAVGHTQKKTTSLYYARKEGTPQRVAESASEDPAA